MEKYVKEFTMLIENFDEKTKKRLNTQVLVNLLNKIKDKNNSDIDQLVNELLSTFKGTANMESFDQKLYRKQYALLVKTVRTTFGYIAKGTLVGEKMSIGIAIGVAIGAGLMTINAGFIGIGIAIGVSLGLVFGSSQEKKEEEKGNIY